MIDPPSSPPLHPSYNEESDFRNSLLPPFSQEESRDYKPRLFVKHKAEIYRNESSSPTGNKNAFLPTPVPTSEANMQASSPPPSSPQLDVRAFTHTNHTSTADKVDSAENRVPLQQLIIVRVPYTGEKVTIGRSSKSSDFVVKSSNRLASRVHASMQYDSKKNILMIECLGWNGLVVNVLQANGTITKYDVKRRSVLNVEGTNGVSLDIHGDKAVVEIVNDSNISDVTEEEVWSLPPNASPVISPLKRRELTGNNKENEYVNAKFSEIQENPILKEDELVKQSKILQEVAVEAVHESAPEGTSPTSETKRFKVELDDSDKGLTKMEDGNSTEMDNKEEKGCSADGERIEKPKNHFIKENLSDSSIHDMSNMVVNFIAFSRLSAVPLTSVQKANSTLQTLSKSQIRDIIQSINCIGIIEGVVEDTTGRRSDDKYYYIPDKDDSRERQIAVQQTKGHRSLRNCRKTSRQYYYRPLQLN